MMLAQLVNMTCLMSISSVRTITRATMTSVCIIMVFALVFSRLDITMPTHVWMTMSVGHVQGNIGAGVHHFMMHAQMVDMTCFIGLSTHFRIMSVRQLNFVTQIRAGSVVIDSMYMPLMVNQPLVYILFVMSHFLIPRSQRRPKHKTHALYM